MRQKLDAGVEEAPDEPDRAKAKKRILEFLNRGLCIKIEEFLDTRLCKLDFNYLKISKLPDIFKYKVFSQRLKSLYFCGSQIASLPDSIGQCSQLTNLELIRTPITSLPDSICHCTNLEFLDLCGSQITSLPASIGHCTNLKRLLLRHSQITSLPNSVLSLSSNCYVCIGNTQLSDNIMNDLREATQAHGYNGPRFFFNMVRYNPNETFLPTQQVIENLYAEVHREQPELDNISMDSQALNQTLNRLCWMAQYKAGGKRKQQLVNQILDYLEKANKVDSDPEFKKIFDLNIEQSSTDCGDRIAFFIIKLDMAYRRAGFDLQTVDMRELAAFLKGEKSLNLLETVAREKVKKLFFVDPIEVYLGYPIMLKEKLKLPISQDQMLHFDISDITEKDLEDAEEFVRAQVDGNVSYLVDQDVWKQALEAQYPERMQFLKEAKEAAMNGDDPDDVAIGELYDKGIVELTQEILG